jgi:hypothetical protein
MSPEKRRVGGLITCCPDCSSESVPKYLGLQSADGKAAGVTILKFDSEADREEYRQMWWVNSGMMVGKSCQLGFQKRTPNVKFTKVHEAGLGMNHKGKL